MTRLGIKGLAVAAALVVGLPANGWAMPPQSGVSIGIANMVVAQAAQAGADTATAPAAPAGGSGLSDATKQGVGCLVTSGATMAYTTFWAGAVESLMIAAGGLLAPASTPTLWLGLASTVVAATCSLGAAATPVVLWAVEQQDNIVANVAWQARQTGTELAALFTVPTLPVTHQLAERGQ